MFMTQDWHHHITSDWQQTLRYAAVALRFAISRQPGVPISLRGIESFCATLPSLPLSTFYRQYVGHISPMMSNFSSWQDRAKTALNF
jgi:hypothetical protein